jgi:hypothetical protein
MCPSNCQNFQLSGVAEHLVQSNVEFKLIVTQDGKPCNCDKAVKGSLKGLRDTVEVGTSDNKINSSRPE